TVFDDLKHLVKMGEGESGLRQHEKMDFLQVSGALSRQIEDRLDLQPFPLRLDQGKPLLRAPQMVGDLGDQTVEVVAEREVEVDLFVDDLDHKETRQRAK